MLQVISHISFCVATIGLTVFIFDIGMEYLQGADTWRILLGQSEIHTQLALLYGGGGIAYSFGWKIGSALPNPQFAEMYGIAIVFTTIASSIIRGYYMLHVHMKRKACRASNP